MRLISCAALLVLFAGCQKEAVSPPPAAREPVAKTVTTTAPPVTVEGKKEVSVAFTQPDLLASFVVGTKSGAATQSSTVARKNDAIGFDVALKSVPDGLAATVEVVDHKETKVFSERKVVPPTAKNVSFVWSDRKRKAGEYKVRLLLGGDQYAEQPLKISE